MEKVELLPKSYQRVESKKWVPKLIVRTDSGGTVGDKIFEWLEKEFDTKEEADSYARAHSQEA